MKYAIRKLKPEDVDAALAMVLAVFMEFEAPDYSSEGVETFKHDIIENAGFIERCKASACPLYGAFDGDRIVGVMGMRESKTHINLAFVRKEYHHRGIATALFRYLLTDRLREDPTLAEITLNSSPYGKGFYLHIGFVPLSEERLTNGIRYTPMKYTVKETDIPASCGAVCAACERYPAECSGCRAIQGKVWWTAYTGQEVCPFYHCCVAEHGFANCGKCAGFPCGIFRRGDPTKSDAENKEILKKQMLALMGEAMDEEE
ncbi:MAG: GNAT family N-acetyltransferase [Clostridiaceae bacterium]|nr:GNAT family N-acetyltransferase [Clostridiaceae bacterium]